MGQQECDRNMSAPISVYKEILVALSTKRVMQESMSIRGLLMTAPIRAKTLQERKRSVAMASRTLFENYLFSSCSQNLRSYRQDPTKAEMIPISSGPLECIIYLFISDLWNKMDTSSDIDTIRI